MENIPTWRVVGGASDDTKEIARKIPQERIEGDDLAEIDDESREIIRQNEIPKTEMEIRLIELANKETNKLMEKFGLRPYDIPEKNIHLLNSETYQKLLDRDNTHAGGASSLQQIIFLNTETERGDNGNMFFASTCFHEMLHLKAHMTIRVEGDEEDDYNVSTFRQGVSVGGKESDFGIDEEPTYFIGLHEAIVADAEKDYVRYLYTLPEFVREKEEREKPEMNELINRITNEENIDKDEIKTIVDLGDGYDVELASYKKLRDVLYYVCTEISKVFQEKYPDMNSVKEEFLKANFTGRLLPIARLVEGTFGKGSFRTLGAMKDTESASAVLQSLIESRGKVLSQSV